MSGAFTDSSGNVLVDSSGNVLETGASPSITPYSLATGAVGDLLNFASNLKLGPWAWNLQPASWRGVRFAVRSSHIRRGRRVVVHEYPFRDDVWVEDIGRGTRVVSFNGFLIGDDVFAQRDRMVAACEAPHTGVLVHPSLGRLTCSLTEFSAGERFDLGRVVEIELSFIESAPAPIFPTSAIATGLQTIVRAVQAVSAIANDYISAVTTALAGVNAGLTFAGNVFGTVRGLLGAVGIMAIAAVKDSAAIASSALGLSGNTGRYGGGTNTSAQPATTTITAALLAVTAARAQAITAAGEVTSAVDPASLPAALQTLMEAVRAVAQDPADQIRILSDLAAFQPADTPTTTAPIGAAVATVQAATAALVRGSALTSIANAITIYQPSSYDDAVTTLRTVTGLLDAHIIAAADAKATQSYLALRALRAGIAADLTARATTLPRLVTVTTQRALPSLTLAYRLYADANRSDDLIARANPVSPMFMPLSFRALGT